jgi:hypothetical protein
MPSELQSENAATLIAACPQSNPPEPVEREYTLPTVTVKDEVLASASEASDAITDALLRRAKKPLKKPCPAVGEGVHKWIFYAACTLTEAGLSDEQAEPIIEELCSRDSKHNEISDALKAARGERSSSTPRWARANPAAVAAAIKSGTTLLELIDRSLEKIQFNGKSGTENYIDAAFPGNPLLCVGRTNSSGVVTVRRENLRWVLPFKQFIVPSPMSSKTGLTKKGEVYPRTLDNTGTRRFLVCEFDSGSLDRQATILWHLRDYAPLVLVVFSGSKSLHGWFFVEGEEDNKIGKFFNYAVSLGADDATWTRSQFVRMPDAFRPKSEVSGLLHEKLREAGRDAPDPRLQAVVYFNRGVIQ